MKATTAALVGIVIFMIALSQFGDAKPKEKKVKKPKASGKMLAARRKLCKYSAAGPKCQLAGEGPSQCFKGGACCRNPDTPNDKAGDGFCVCVANDGWYGRKCNVGFLPKPAGTVAENKYLSSNALANNGSRLLNVWGKPEQMDSFVLARTFADTQQACADQCSAMLADRCNSFNYQFEIGICELLSVNVKQSPLLSDGLLDAPGWIHICCFGSSNVQCVTPLPPKRGSYDTELCILSGNVSHARCEWGSKCCLNRGSQELMCICNPGNQGATCNVLNPRIGDPWTGTKAMNNETRLMNTQNRWSIAMAYYSTSNMTECVVHCENAGPQCRSFNFDQKENICELIGTDQQNPGLATLSPQTSLVASPDWVHVCCKN